MYGECVLGEVSDVGLGKEAVITTQVYEKHSETIVECWKNWFLGETRRDLNA